MRCAGARSEAQAVEARGEDAQGEDAQSVRDNYCACEMLTARAREAAKMSLALTESTR